MDVARYNVKRDCGSKRNPFLRISSPDIPLNVSRSYLQSDSAVKKISGYITKKVASRLEDIFKNDRADFEAKWDDIKIFIEYGMLTDQKFCDAAMKFVLLKDVDDKYYTLDEYRTLIEPAQTDKDGTVIYLYTTDKAAQYNYIRSAQDKGYSVLLMDGQLDSHFIGLLEQKIEKSHFVRVDGDIIDNIIRKEDKKEADLTPLQRNILSTLFQSQIPAVDGANFIVSFESLNYQDSPVIITQNEYMRRMKEMAAMQPGMNFYGELPDSYNLIVNIEQPLVKRVKDAADEALEAKVLPMQTEIDTKNAEITKLRESKEEADKQKSLELEKEVGAIRENMTKQISEYAATQPLVKQLIDLALLGNGLLKGSQLSDFIRRSVELL